MSGETKPARVHAGDDTLGNRVADAVASFAGSWRFILSFLAVLVLWMAVNTVQTFVPQFDRPPFIGLNLVLSCIAALQAPFILMAANRQAAKDRVRDDTEAIEVQEMTDGHTLLVQINKQQLEILRRLDAQ